MKKLLATSVLSFGFGLLFSTVQPVWSVQHYRTRQQYLRHRRHMRTAKRVGIGAAGGAVIGGAWPGVEPEPVWAPWPGLEQAPCTTATNDIAATAGNPEICPPSGSPHPVLA